MIRIDGETIYPEYYPAGELRLKYAVFPKKSYTVEWLYEGEAELFTLICLCKHIESAGGALGILYIPYLPNARMDRVKRDDEVFTLKYFCEVINALEFEKVYVNNPHSDVCMALLNRAEDAWITGGKRLHNNDLIFDLIGRLGLKSERDILFYPDAGCAKKYEGVIQFPYLTGHKKRNWSDGQIQSLDVAGDIPEAPWSALIVDDICSYGGTFLHSAKKLKDLGADKLWLYITHCENSVLEGELISCGLLEKIYTTRSIFTAKAPEIIEVLEGIHNA
jgi:ribose-phosphate pyrophosphokinase